MDEPAATALSLNLITQAQLDQYTDAIAEGEMTEREVAERLQKLVIVSQKLMSSLPDGGACVMLREESLADPGAKLAAAAHAGNKAKVASLLEKRCDPNHVPTAGKNTGSPPLARLPEYKPASSEPTSSLISAPPGPRRCVPP